MAQTQHIVPPPPHLVSFNAFRDFPWHNGSILRGPAIEQEVKRWFEEEPPDYQDIDPSILIVSHQ